MNIDNNLLDVLEAKQEFVRNQGSINCYVSIYQVERCYDGPEEGGWWYDGWTLYGHIPCANEEEAVKIIEASEAELKAKNVEHKREHSHTYDVLGDEPNSSYPEGYIPRGWSDGGEFKLITEFTLGSHDNSNQPSPRYE